MASKKKVVESSEPKTERKRTLIEKDSHYQIFGRSEGSDKWEGLQAYGRNAPQALDMFKFVSESKVGEDYEEFQIRKIAICEIPNGQ